MKRILLLTLIALMLSAGMADAHRMFIGPRVTLDLYAFYDDGTPASNAKVRLYQDGELFVENVTDAGGKFSVVLPGKGTGKWQYEVLGDGHTEKGFLNIDCSAPVQAAALGLCLLGPLVLISRKRRSKGI